MCTGIALFIVGGKRGNCPDGDECEILYDETLCRWISFAVPAAGLFLGWMCVLFGSIQDYAPENKKKSKKKMKTS